MIEPVKPKDLPIFGTWDEREPELRDKVLYIPTYFDRHDKGLLPSLSSIFETDAPFNIEFCSGNGEWVAKMAAENPHIYWIAVERKFERVRKIWSKMKNASLNNLLIVWGTAEDFIDHYLPESKISQIFINFPDPWPKLRHAKHRLIKEPFIERMAAICRPGGSALIVTDDTAYSHQVISVIGDSDKWKMSFPEPHFVESYENYGSSYFNRLWLEKGKTIRYMKFERI
jgi:tRNA (guanine-N7-)-methyltransferase